MGMMRRLTTLGPLSCVSVCTIYMIETNMKTVIYAGRQTRYIKSCVRFTEDQTFADLWCHSGRALNELACQMNALNPQ